MAGSSNETDRIAKALLDFEAAMKTLNLRVTKVELYENPSRPSVDKLTIYGIPVEVRRG